MVNNLDNTQVDRPTLRWRLWATVSSKTFTSAPSSMTAMMSWPLKCARKEGVTLSQCVSSPVISVTPVLSLQLCHSVLERWSQTRWNFNRTITFICIIREWVDDSDSSSLKWTIRWSMIRINLRFEQLWKELMVVTCDTTCVVTSFTKQAIVVWPWQHLASTHTVVHLF